ARTHPTPVMPKHNLPAELPLLLAITGASGAVYATRLLEVLVDCGREVHLMISPSGAAVIKQELKQTIELDQFDPRSLLPTVASENAAGQIRYHHYQDFMAQPASGSFLTGGMVVC